MFSLFKKKPAAEAPAEPAAPLAEAALPALSEPAAEARSGWFTRLKQGLRKTGSGIAQVFTGTRIDDALYEDLEAALLMADAGVDATEYLLTDLKRRVKESKATEPAAVKQLLADALADEGRIVGVVGIGRDEQVAQVAGEGLGRGDEGAVHHRFVQDVGLDAGAVADGAGVFAELEGHGDRAGLRAGG